MDKENKKNLAEESGDDKNLPVIVAQEVEPAYAKASADKREKDEAIELAGGKLDVKKSGNIIIGTINVMARPITEHLKNRHERFYRDSKFHLVADIVFVLAILGLVFTAVYLLNLRPKAQIDLQISTVSDNVQSGQGETFVVQYKNNSKMDIKAATLSLVFPKNFTLQAVNPQNIWSDQTNTFTIGDLPRGANGKVKFTGVPQGVVGTDQTINYSLNYSENGRTANTLGSYMFTLESSVLRLSFDAPKQIYQNLDFAGNINLKNTGQADVAGEIDLFFANSPIIIKSISSDAANLVNGVIIVNGLKAGQSAAIEYEASTDAGGGTVPAVLEADLNLGGQKMKQASADLNLNVTVPKFGVTISSDKNVINSEDTVNFKLNFINKEGAAINSSTLTIMPADSAAVIKNLTLANGADKYKISGNTIALGNLSVGQSGELDFSARLSRQTISASQQTGIVANVNYQVNGRAVEYQMFSPKIKFLSDLQIGSKGLYYSAQGDQLGIGPLPPVVDAPTRYWIFWEINNSGNELKNLAVSADLPANVGWTNQKTVLAGDVRYGEISHKVVWTVDDIAASGGNYRVGFEIELIPTAADLGKVPALISNIRYSATDSFANQEISGSLSDINANLKDDPSVSGKGTVIQLKIVK
ncbi:MAG: hypothetical protein PHO56_01880 [Patescibacteria group bacterium]|nr:hypothetical protein [Patescibacteria group bacterium]